MGAPVTATEVVPIVPPAPNRTPEQWRDLLSKQLTDRWNEVKVYDEYYDGKHKLRFAGEKYRTEFGHLFRDFADNWCQIVADAPEERCTVEGFRLNDATASDKAAWDIWQRNGLDAESQIAHLESLIAGVSYILVAPGDPVAEITIEHASEMIVATAPGSRRQRLAALKQWDDGSKTYATLYLPGFIYKWEAPSVLVGVPKQWVKREPAAETWPMKNAFGEVPVVALRNRPRLRVVGQSELVGVLPMQDAVNKLVADMLTASEFAAFIQRWATGIELEEGDDGKPISPWKVGIDKILTMENPDARFGQFSASDLGNYVKAIELIVQHIASQTRTPPHYFYLSGQFPSGESIKSAETGLVAKAKRKMRHWGEAWEDVIRLAFATQADGPEAFDAETIWGDPESRTESEHIDAIVKKKAIGVPDEQLQEDAGYSPQQIRRFKGMAAQATLLNPFPQPPQPAPQIPVG